MRDPVIRPYVHRLAWASAVLAALGSVVALVAAGGLMESTPLLDRALVVVAAASAALVVIVPVRSRMLRRQTVEIARQEATLQAAAFAAERFLLPDGLEDGLREILQQLGQATHASRVFVYENSLDPAGRLLMSIRHEWVAEGIAPTIDDPENQDYPYANGFAHWERTLETGIPLQAHVSEVDGVQREDMEAQEVRSLTVVPVFVAGEWWGYLGIDDCRANREWSSAELEAITAAVATMGAAIARERATSAVMEAEERFRVLVERAPAVVYVDSLNDVASAIYMSPQIEALVGYTVEEWRSDPDLWLKLLHPDDVERALELNARHNETGEPFRMEYRLIARDGRVVWVRDEAVMIRAADGTFLHSQGLMQDVTEAKAAEERIEFLAYHDGLTGLPNQTMFTTLVDLALARAHRSDLAVAVLSLDVDGFKLANATLGTESGDRLLQQVAERLAATIRETDTLARGGADDFLILLADLERGEVGELQASLLFAESVAGRIREALAEPFDIEGTEVFVSASVGISVHPDDARNVEELLMHAETAMLSSKRSGPGGFAIYDVGVVDSATKFAFVARLHKAADRKEWVLHYQPIVELATGAIQGVEALVRWQTDDGEMIPPNEFIPLAEELGLIEAIGDWVLEELVRQDHAWRAEGLRLEMSFNLSPRQFWQPDLAERIFSRLDKLRTDPRNVVAEITEGTAMRDPDRAQAVLWDLRSRGLRLAIDDFGTGYSSLSRLRTMPIDVLKIDRSFVSRVDEDPQAAKIVAAFIQLGQGLGMMTLAEGIETEGEWRFLAEQGCELGQGFYFSRPVPANAISSRFRAGELILAGTH